MLTLFTYNNGKIQSVGPEPIANGVSIVNENALVWTGKE